MPDSPRGTARSRRTQRRQEAYTTARIRLWGQDVGVVLEDRQDQIVFEYVDAFRSSGLELSPIHLPLARRGPIAFPHLQRVESFLGLPGLLADSLPDAFGNAVIRRYFEQRGAPDAAMSPVQRLLYIGSRAMGALEFSPALDRLDGRAEEALQVARLVEEARRIIEGDTNVAVPEMMQVGASAGGARAKALILWNRGAGRVKSAFAPRDTGDEHCLIKFDGVTGGAGGHVMVKEFAPGPFGRIEYAYSRMARAAGVDMSETHLLREREFAHFMTKRFDRHGSARIHMHTLAGLHHADYAIRQILSYEDYFRTIRRLGMGQTAVNQAFRRLVFNIAARNQDDHVKNFAFLMGPDGKWRLAPAFDVTWAYGGKWSLTHQMTAGGKDDDFTRADLLAVGSAFDVPGDGADILNEVEAALELWVPEAQAAGLAPEWIRKIQSSFRHVA
ncbi:MAG TPA: type II toxin-antitoxin system HipA family toxin [Gemmatimonadaceae bacterium]|nr:type II toxin-antitoxin system HipA family toxin [Gemmatimonadaceae bacterium]